MRGVDDLKGSFRENCDDVKFFVLINCGGGLDIVELLEPEEDITFFVLDSHRPTDLCNIYSERQIRLLWKHDDDNDVPTFEDVFSDDEEEEVSVLFYNDCLLAFNCLFVFFCFVYSLLMKRKVKTRRRDVQQREEDWQKKKY